MHSQLPRFLVYPVALVTAILNKRISLSLSLTQNTPSYGLRWISPCLLYRIVYETRLRFLDTPLCHYYVDWIRLDMHWNDRHTNMMLLKPPLKFADHSFENEHGWLCLWFTVFNCVLLMPMQTIAWNTQMCQVSQTSGSFAEMRCYLWVFRLSNIAFIKATPTIVGEAFIFYLWTFFIFFATHRHSR